MPLTNYPLITVFIPVYNGENFILETLSSLKSQLLKDFEVILIDDHSTDGSLELLQKHTASDPRFRVLQTPINLGDAAKVLKYGLKYVNGTYFVYSSQDDLFSDDWLSSMHKRAIETNADATIPDLVFFNPSQPTKDRALIGVNGNKEIILSGREAFSYSLDWTIPGNALWRTDLVKKIGYDDFCMNADEYSVRVFFLNCNRVAFSGGTFYYRQNNPNAITKKISVKSFSTPYTNLKLWSLAKDHGFDIRTQSLLLNGSIHGLMYFVPLAHKKEFRSALPKLKEIFYQYKDYGIESWMKENKTKDLRSLLSRLALKSYTLFVCIGYLKASVRHMCQYRQNESISCI